MVCSRCWMGEFPKIRGPDIDTNVVGFKICTDTHTKGPPIDRDSQVSRSVTVVRVPCSAKEFSRCFSLNASGRTSNFLVSLFGPCEQV